MLYGRSAYLNPLFQKKGHQNLKYIYNTGCPKKFLTNPFILRMLLYGCNVRARSKEPRVSSKFRVLCEQFVGTRTAEFCWQLGSRGWSNIVHEFVKFSPKTKPGSTQPGFDSCGFVL